MAATVDYEVVWFAQIVIVSMAGLPPAPDARLSMNVEAGNFDERAAIPACQAFIFFSDVVASFGLHL